ncbi:MAG: hypothetical protein AB1721_00235 [Patescibacteria group bacterium]
MTKKARIFIVLSLFISLILWPGMFLVEKVKLKNQVLNFEDCLQSLEGKVVLGAPEQCIFKSKNLASQDEPKVFIKDETNVKIKSFFLDSDGENLIIKGENLARVEIWGKQGNKKNLWGQAVLASENQGSQAWLFKLPKEPILITELFGFGFNQENKLVSEVSFPVAGASSFYQVFWAEPNKRVFGVEPDEEFKLFGGQVGVLNSGDLAVAFEKINQDSRCPTGVYCVSAGQVSARFKVYFADQLPLSVVLSLDPENPELALFQDKDYSIQLVSVLPFPSKNKEIEPNDYQTFLRIQR